MQVFGGWKTGAVALVAGLLWAGIAQGRDVPVPTGPEQPLLKRGDAQDGQQADPDADAQPAQRGPLDEIIVSASRRDQSLQDVAVAVTAFSAETIAERELSSVADLQMQTPGLTFAQVVGQGQITIRGVGSDLYTINAEPGVAMYLNDIYLARIFLSQAAMLGLERVEVLRGPQGTLYGRNTSGGAIKFVTKRPTDEFEARAAAQIGSFQQRVGEASLSGPIVEDVLKARIGAYWEDHDGWTTNLANGHKLDHALVNSVAGTVDFAPARWLSFTLDIDYQREKRGSPTIQTVTPLVATSVSDSLALPLLYPFDGLVRSLENATGFLLTPVRQALVNTLDAGHSTYDPRAVYADADAVTRMKTRGLALTGSADLGFATFKMIAGGRKHDLESIYDADGSDLPVIVFDPQTATSKQLSLEAQLQSPGDGRLRWIAGLYGFDDDALETYNIDLLVLNIGVLDQLGLILPPNLPYLQGGAVGQIDIDTHYDTRSYAAFADVEYDLLDWLTLHAGGRYTRDEKNAVIDYYAADLTNNCSNLRLEKSWSAFTGKVGVDARIGEGRMVYASFSQGFKSGGFNSTGCDPDPYDPEYVDAFEGGVKSEWWDRRLRVNLAAFYYAFTDIQVQQINGLLTYITNAAEATVKGAELEMMVAPLDWLTIDGTLTLLDATYDNFIDDEALTLLIGNVDLSGNRLPKSPKLASSLGISIRQPVWRGYDGALRVEWIYKGLQYFTQFNNEPTSQEAFHLFNAYFTVTNLEGGAGLQLFVKNITDVAYKEGGIVASALVGGPGVFYAAPRRWGLELSYTF